MYVWGGMCVTAKICLRNFLKVIFLSNRLTVT